MQGRSGTFLVYLASSLYLTAFVGVKSAGLPHVNECNYCNRCHYTNDGKTDAVPPPLEQAILQQDPAVSAKLIAPSISDQRLKASRPNCTECWGCSTQIEQLKGFSAFGHKFAVEIGASSEWLFYADLPDTHLTGKKAIVKVWCLPYDKVSGRFEWRCGNTQIAFRAAQHLIAVDKVTQECGLLDTTIKVWLAPVNAIMPGTGLHVWWYGLWMERAEGLSLNQLAYLGKRDLVESLVINLLHAKLNHTLVVKAAIYDLLTSQCDRHSQNVYINEEGRIKLIDNINSLRFSWEHCSVDSLFLPGTQKNEIVRFGGNIVTKRVKAKARKSINPMILMDYRCYVEGGKLGTNYPPEVTQCLRRLSSMSPVKIREIYGFSDTYIAELLNRRATDMLARGFEWTLKRGKPVNKAALRYKWHQPCCKVKQDTKTGLACAHGWNVTPSFPIGNPLRGGPWDWGYPDPGQFDGDKLWS